MIFTASSQLKRDGLRSSDMIGERQSLIDNETAQSGNKARFGIRWDLELENDY